MIAFYFTRLHELSELISIFASSGVRSTDFLILLVEALCFILGNENVGNFHNEQEWHKRFCAIWRGIVGYLCSLRFSYDPHYHNIVLQSHASLF